MLRDMQSKHPGIDAYECDLSEPDTRVAFVDKIVREHPALDVLINNAGIQQRIDLTNNPAWEVMHREMAINLEAHIHMCTLLIPQLRKQEKPAILNVTSGLAFVPLAGVPVYCATKAAMHSFTQSLRHQLRETPIHVVEVIPPAVDTDLGGSGLHTFGVPLDEFADAAFAALRNEDHREVTYQFSSESSRASREQLDAIFERMNAPRR